MNILFISLMVVLFLATLSDIRSHRIPNWLTYSAMAVGVGYHAHLHGMQGLLFSLGGASLGLLLMIFFYLSGGMGAGDVKLMGAVGAFLGASGVFTTFLCTSLIGGLYALVVIVRNGRFSEYVRRYRLMLRTIVLTHKLVYIPPRGDEAMPVLCYGGVIALGTSITVLGIIR
jgi:prepilin peptidase CpaA